MAEHLERRPKQSKVFSTTRLNSPTHLQSEDDLMGQTGRKKGRPPKGNGRMNPASLNVSHQSISPSAASSKTVAAILKQQKDSRLPEDATVMRQQLPNQLQGKKQNQKGKAQVASSNFSEKLHYSKNVASPVSAMCGSPAMAISPAMSPSGSQGVSPSGKEHGHPVATKSSSLSRDLSPSRITAQMVKVMADTSTSSTPNLLLSALQGNMPDPMGILSTSKTEGGLVTVVTTSITTSLNNIASATRKSSANMNPNSDSLSSLQSQRNTFSSMLTSMAGASGGYLTQASDLEERDSTPDNIALLNQSQSTVDLLTAPSGSMQTVNVSHTPKSTIPQAFNSGGSSPSSSSPRSSARSAMEVAQQIKMEANGQSASAQRAALQQQLRSQIKSSRSIDAQLASRQNPGPFAPGQGNPNLHRHSTKDPEQQKTLEASMPLLASKLSSTSETAHIANTGTGQLQHHRQQNLPMDSALLKASLASSSAVPPSSLSASLVSSSSSASSLSTSIATLQRRTGSSPFSHHKSGIEPRQQRPMSHTQLQKQLQQPGLNFPHPMPLATEPHPVGVDPSWLMDDQAPQSVLNQQLPKKTPVSLNDLLSVMDSDNSQSMSRFVPVTMGNMAEQTVQTEIPIRVEGKIQTSSSSLVTKHLRSISQSANIQGSGGGVISQVNQGGSASKGKLSQSIQPVGIGGLSQNFISQGAKTGLSGHVDKKRRSGPGETKQTAIDVDVDFGNLSSLARESRTRAKNVSSLPLNNCASDEPNLGFQQPFPNSSNSSFLTTDATVVRDITGASLTNLGGTTSGVDLQSFLPIQSHINVISTSSSTISSFLSKSNVTQVTSTLAQIPRPIMHVYSSPSSLTSATPAAPLPPPPDYNPPPPYPSRTQQQQQQHLQNHLQQHNSQSKTGHSLKESIPNPFTFPTTGVKVQTSHDALGHLPYSISPHLSEKPGGNVCNFKEDVRSSTGFGDYRIGGLLEKSQSDISSLSRQQRDSFGRMGLDTGMPRLCPETSVKMEIKLEEDSKLYNHVGHSVKDECEISAEQKQLTQPFNQRVANLSCFPVTNSAYRAAYRTHTVAVQRARSGVITNTAKSLDILRQNLQRSMNKEITEIIKKYTSKYFEPALSNIRENNNEGLLGNEHINHVCRQILEEAKSEFSSASSRRSVTPTALDMTDNTSETGSINGRRTNNAKRGRISDSDSEKGSDVGSIRRPVKRKGRPPVHGSGRLTPSKPLKSGEPIKREGPKWDPERIKPSTLFVMGARANKALGLGNTRGRLYIRHPDVFKYIGDPEDKVWLYDRSLMPPTGGKAYLLLLEDIEDLSRSDEYRDSPGLMMHECVGFHVPEWMMVKMKEQMQALRSDSQKRSRSRSPVIGNVDSRPRSLPFSSFTDAHVKDEVQPSPADTEDMEFLSAVDNDDTRPSSAISPFNVGAGFEEGSSISPSELDAMDEQAVVQSIYA